jgi:hypothetical protein
VIEEIMSFVVQGGSAYLLFSSSTVNIGQEMVVGGLFIHIIMSGLFALPAAIFQVYHRPSLLSGIFSDSSPFPVETSLQPYSRLLQARYSVEEESTHALRVSGLFMIHQFSELSNT